MSRREGYGMNDRVLFLDVDGVLNCLATWRTCDDMLDADCCRRLFALLDLTGAKVVLSSSWRGMPGLEARLARAGIMDHVVGRTPHISDPDDSRRGREIADWLASHPTPPTRYAIVDDDSDMLPEQQPFFVQTDFQNGGLMDEHVELLAEILMGP
jgi:hypothetical protein